MYCLLSSKLLWFSQPLIPTYIVNISDTVFIVVDFNTPDINLIIKWFVCVF